MNSYLPSRVSANPSARLAIGSAWLNSTSGSAWFYQKIPHCQIMLTGGCF